MFRTKVVEKIKTNILYSETIFRIRVVYEIMWENTVERARPRMAKCRMRIACWISKATNTQTHTHTGCVSLLFHCNNGSTNALQCYVIRTLPVWLVNYFNKRGIHYGFRNVLVCCHNSGNMFALCFLINCLQSLFITVVLLLIL
jgi:hypothetical protein